MRPLRCSVNVSCVDHASGAFTPDEEIHEHFAESIARADALVYGRLTYERMSVRRVLEDGVWADRIDPSI